MSGKDDVVRNFMSLGMVQTIKSKHIKKIIRFAVNYGFAHGESFGKYEKYADEVMDKYLIQPENDRAWEKELAELRERCSKVNLEGRILLTIAEMILYRRKGD